MKKAKQKNQEIEREILFQKLGSTWFIFTEIKGDVVYSQLPQGMDPYTTKLELYEVIEQHMVRVAGQKREIEQAA